MIKLQQYPVLLSKRRRNPYPGPLRPVLMKGLMKIMKKLIAAGLCAALMVCSLAGCGQSGGYRKNSELASSKPVRLTVTGGAPSSVAMEEAAAAFKEIYPNCTVEYEYLQDYADSLPKRLESNDSADLFLTNNITANSPLLTYALELSGQKDRLDLSNTYEGLIRNFTITADGSSGLYAVPLGGEMRGMYVNKTLLAALGLSVPKNYSELMDCCAKLLDAGYVPLQGNPGSFGQLLMYPYVCSIIANSADYQKTYDQVNSCAAGVSELFRQPMTRLYDMVSKGYYNYKYVEKTDGAFKESTDDAAVKGFLNIVTDAAGNAAKKDDVGKVAFMPGIMSLKSLLDKTRDDYHSGIEYEFILSPVGDEGGYAYLSPAAGIAVNKNGANTAWALEFVNYLMSDKANRAYAARQNIIPNTGDAMDSINSAFSTPSDRVCQLGQVTFGYVFYDVMKKALMDVSKANNPKYMQADGTMYGLDHYMTELEGAFAKAGS
jgi:ABC-type glycerol-3-phosphate transport system substrate-binding protein